MTSQEILDIFKVITTIPRESGFEQPMTDYLVKWAAEHGFACKKDSTGNVCITREASKGYENVPTVVLQAHQDMVCEKLPGTEHDFRTDPIQYEIEDGWMIARTTTLGADDGIGIAACLAALLNDKPCGKLECLFTISEETGMDGAFALEKGFFTGNTLINLDSEDEGQLFIGCAGGVNTNISFDCTGEPSNKDWTCLELSISGATGGHSGDDIDKGRANAVQLLSAFLSSEFSYGLQLHTIEGGGKHNAIARDASAGISVPDASATEERFGKWIQLCRLNHAESDPELTAEAQKCDAPSSAISSEQAGAILHCLATAPHGVIAMSSDIPGLVETSTNLAAVRMDGTSKLIVTTSQRSSVQSSLDDIAAVVRHHFENAGATVEHENPYPGWAPNVKSPILEKCVAAYEKLFAQRPIVRAIHAGLECGLFLDKFPDLDMISFGPTLRGVHAPGEKLELQSLDRFTSLLEYVLCN